MLYNDPTPQQVLADNAFVGGSYAIVARNHAKALVIIIGKTKKGNVRVTYGWSKRKKSWVLKASKLEVN